LILVTQTAELKGVLEPFYDALGLPFRLESVADLPGGDVPRTIRALAATVGERYGATETEIGEKTIQRARSLRERWRAKPHPPGPVSGNL
ncbi:MAG: hypothetical protein M3P92_05060, partial [Actinomycetota bacterium]|nr:hypothetical protein [Actinomycetota bacterium]